MLDKRVRVTKCGRRKVAWCRWGRRVGVVFMNTAINMERVKILMVRTANKPREQFSINCWNTDNKILLSKDSIKVMNGHYVQVYRKSGRRKLDKKGYFWLF